MGITLGSNFTVSTTLPLDDRTKVADNTARNAIDAGRRYEGLTVYVVATAKSWQLQGGILDANWVDMGDPASKASLAGGNTFTGTQTLSNDLIVGGYLKRSVALAVIANAGGGQASATALTKDINRVTTVATAGDSVKLPSLSGNVGLCIFIQNDGAASLNVFPASGEYINGLAVDTALAVPAGTNVLFWGVYTNTWKSFSSSAAITTKGDLLTFDTSPTRLAAGADGYVLTADSAQAKGIKWAAAPTTYAIRAGRATLASGIQSKAVTFSTAMADTNYALTCNFENTTDADPYFIQHYFSAKSTTGFTVTFNATTDTANYVMNWQATANV